MQKLKPKYIVNEKGEKTSVLLSIKEYDEMLENIKLYDKTKSSNPEFISAELAFDLIEKSK